MASVGFVGHLRIIFSRAKGDTGERLTEWLKQEALLVFATAVVTYVFSPGGKWERLLLGVLIPLGGLAAWVIGLFIWNFITAPWKVHQDQECEHSREMKIASARIASLQQELSKLAPILEMAEEDPKVYLRPLNQEFLMLGFMGFELINDGQRVNPAQGVAVQTIPCIPSVHFELVDHLRANESKRILPTTDGYISPSHDILSALNESWRNAWERQELNEVMELDAEFPFEIKIAYHDFRPRKFETTVNLRYCPVEHEAARSSVGTGKRREYIFLKVIDQHFKRLA